MGWFARRLGGLDRYYRALLEQLPEAGGVVIGPAGTRPRASRAVSAHDAPLARRLYALLVAPRGAPARDAEILDAHFALYALAPLTVGGLCAGARLVVPLPRALGGGERRGRRRLAARARAAQGARAARPARADAVVVLSSAFRRVLVERYRRAPVGCARVAARRRRWTVHPG